MADSTESSVGSPQALREYGASSSSSPAISTSRSPHTQPIETPSGHDGSSPAPAYILPPTGAATPTQYSTPSPLHPGYQEHSGGYGDYGEYERMESAHLQSLFQNYIQPAHGTQNALHDSIPLSPTTASQSTQSVPTPLPIPKPAPPPPAALPQAYRPYQPYPNSATNSTSALHPTVNVDAPPPTPVKRVRVASRKCIWICFVILAAIAVAVAIGVTMSKKDARDKSGGNGDSGFPSPEYWKCRDKCNETSDQCEKPCFSGDEYKTCMRNCAGDWHCEVGKCKQLAPCFVACRQAWGTCSQQCGSIP